MAVFRVEKNANYTTMCNYHLRDQSISLKAKGMLSMLLSLPDTWKYSVRGLAAISLEGVDGIMTALKELETHGYLERRRLRQANGRLGQVEYTIYEMPRSKPCSDSPCTENPYMEKPYTAMPDEDLPYTEKPAEINKERRNNQLSNKEEKEADSGSTVRHKYGVYKNVLLSDEEIQKLKAEFPSDYESRIERLSEYMASSGKHYKSHLATIRSWARSDAKQKKAMAYSHENYQYEEGESL